MAEYPFLPLATDAYLADTGHLTTLEHGAYLLLLMTMWRNKGSLPNEDRLLARYARLTAGQWKRIKPTIMPFFIEEEGALYQGRLTDELTVVRQRTKSQSQNARARWLKTKGADDASAPDRQTHGNAPTPTPTPTSKTPEGELAGSRDKSSPQPVREAFDFFVDAVAHTPIPKPRDLTVARKRAIKARLCDVGVEGWQQAVGKLVASDWCTGRTDKGWVADLDFLLQPSKFTKLREGGYDNHNNRAQQGPGPPRRGHAFDDVAAAMHNPPQNGFS